MLTRRQKKRHPQHQLYRLAHYIHQDLIQRIDMQNYVVLCTSLQELQARLQKCVQLTTHSMRTRLAGRRDYASKLLYKNAINFDVLSGYGDNVRSNYIAARRRKGPLQVQSARDIYEDLRALAREPWVSDLQVKLYRNNVDELKKELIVTTTDIHLPLEHEEGETCNMGRYVITMDFGDVHKDLWAYHVTGPDLPNLYKYQPSSAYPGCDESGVLCEGESHPMVESAMHDGRLLDLFTMLHGLLSSYSGTSVYWLLDDWLSGKRRDGTTNSGPTAEYLEQHAADEEEDEDEETSTRICRECECEYDSDDSGTTCNRCGNDCCDNCYSCCGDCETSCCSTCARSCNDCGGTTCTRCQSNCQLCRERVCDSCKTFCSTCSRICCDSCRSLCDGDDCTRILCETCLQTLPNGDEGEYCETCYAQLVAEAARDAVNANEENPDVQTQTEAPPSDAPEPIIPVGESASGNSPLAEPDHPGVAAFGIGPAREHARVFNEQIRTLGRTAPYFGYAGLEVSLAAHHQEARREFYQDRSVVALSDFLRTYAAGDLRGPAEPGTPVGDADAGATESVDAAAAPAGDPVPDVQPASVGQDPVHAGSGAD